MTLFHAAVMETTLLNTNKHILFLNESCVSILFYLKMLWWQSVGCNTGYQCYNFEYELIKKKEFFSYTVLSWLIDVYFLHKLMAVIKFKD